MKNPQKKGKDFEREIAHDLSKKFDCPVRRTPCSGAIHDFMSQDIIAMDKTNILSELHIECKKQQSLNGHKVYWRTKKLAGAGKTACVIWAKNFDPEPVVVLGYNDFCNLLLEIQQLRT
jgi:Holliday junction resolvase